MRHSKGPGGLLGITRQPKTINVWALSLHTTSKLVKDLCDLNSNSEALDATHRKEESKSRIKSDMEDQQKIAEDTDPPDIDPTNYGWVRYDTMKNLKPVTLPEEIAVAPADVLNVIKCNCSSEKSCSSTRCTCAGKLPCTIFCQCYGKECFNLRTRN
ncbi:hypothetical protein PR048_025443 [Dryococelus australis]|uniref:Uncharacterized protein n=1 Tax=Dryococelus australis TaxID=614101 RepID=A0ABQ9GRA2_9NEOP|nr:hypothetical protein PR048_025443 [Dryococelus australis]